MSSTSLFCNKFGGINKLDSSFSSSKITASDMQNVELFNTGINSGVGIRTMKGNKLICSLLPAGEKIINIFESVQQTKVYFFVHTESATEGKIYLFIPDSNILTQKTNGLSVTGKSSAADFAQGWSDLFVFSNGENLLSIEIGKYNDSGVLQEVKTISVKDMDSRTVKGLGVVNFDNRLWIFNGNILWYSVQQNIYDFSTSASTIVTSAGYIEFVKNITAITSYLGSLAVFHKESSCLVELDDDKAFYVSSESPAGCASYNALVFHGTELYFYDDTKKAMFSFNQTILGTKTIGDNMAVNLQEELCDINFSEIDKIRMLSVIQSDRNEFWFLVPTNSETYSTIFIFDYNNKEWVKRLCPKISCVNIVNGILYSGDSTGKIYQEYLGDDFHGTFVASSYTTSPLNLGVDNLLKILFVPPKISLDLAYSNNFYIQYIKNYDTLGTTKIKNIVATSLSNALYWDIGNFDTMYFAPEKTNQSYKLPSENFKTLEIKFYTQRATQEFCIKNIEFSDIKLKQLS